jgi:hypothetical protein
MNTVLPLLGIGIGIPTSGISIQLLLVLFLLGDVAKCRNAEKS